MRKNIYALLLLGTISTPICQGTEVGRDGPALGLAQQFREAREHATSKIHGSVQFVAGNDLWQPGRQYKSGSNWLALICDGKGCLLAPAALEAKEESWQGHYDDQPTAGQHLSFTTAASAPGKPVAWLRTTGAPAWLKSAPVPSYYAGGRYKQLPGKEGTMELLLEPPDGSRITLVPMLVRKALVENLLNKKDGSVSYGTLLLQLRTTAKRQLLPGEFGSCTGEVTPGYLLWAGDLDGDGKPDFLVSYIDADGPVHLFLSGAARRGQMVGLAGVFNSPPFGGECDGGPPPYLN